MDTEIMLSVRHAKLHHEDFRGTSQTVQACLRSRRQGNERNGTGLDRKVCGASRKENEVKITRMARARRWMVPNDGPLPRIAKGPHSMAKNILRKVTPETTEKPREIGDNDPVSITVTRTEIQTLFDAARALDLMHKYCDGEDEQQMITVGLYFDLLKDQVWDVVSELQGRFRDVEVNREGGAQ
jgi:hypothetical protein